MWILNVRADSFYDGGKHKSLKEILKSKDDQMKNINNEIANITKLTVGKITNMELSDNELTKVIETHKGNFN